jgi:hypothetical protein
MDSMSRDCLGTDVIIIHRMFESIMWVIQIIKQQS